MNSRKQKIGLIIGITIMTVLALAVIISFFYMPYDANAMDSSIKFNKPSSSHWFGTDNYGRDVFTRTVEGVRTTFVISICTVGIGAVIGTLIGAFTGYIGGWLDEIVMRINDTLASFPSILVALVLVCILGTGKGKLVLIMGLVFIPSYARVMRSEYIRLKNRDFVNSAKLMGCSKLRIIFRHILPNTVPALLSAVAIGFNNAVLTEASLSYLGIGVQPPYPSLGRMLSEAQGYFSYSWCVIFPGVVMVLMILGFVLLSEGIAGGNRHAGN